MKKKKFCYLMRKIHDCLIVHIFHYGRLMQFYLNWNLLKFIKLIKISNKKLNQNFCFIFKFLPKMLKNNKSF